LYNKNKEKIKMDLADIINKRRAYRSFDPINVSEDLIKDLADYIKLAPSCFNNQPWRFVFVYEKNMLEKMLTSLSKGNQWASGASMIIAVFSIKSEDCILPEDREYYLFDTGMASAYLILRAVELGLVAHPIAGYDEKHVKEILDIPEEAKVITLIIAGRHSNTINPILNEKQIESEKIRPSRKSTDNFVFLNSYKQPMKP
jgi:nitroreductase